MAGYRFMEVLIRCQVPDVPGMLASVAGAIGEAGGDIEAVEVVESVDGQAIDDLWVRTTDLATIADHLEALDGVMLIHAGVSRGLPGDATARLATGVEALMSGAMLPEDGLVMLIGGLLRADHAEVLAIDQAPTKRDRRVLQFDVEGGVLVLRREYRFLASEIQRARHVLAMCERAAAIGAGV